MDPSAPQAFDAYAADYDAALNQGLALSGEGKDFFARGRIQWLARCLDRAGISPRTVLDFGCGTGSATPFFLEVWPALQRIVGLDVSAASLEVARREHGGQRVEFAAIQEYGPDASMDLVFCNGVFHHVPPEQRPAAVRFIRDCLRPAGLLALWENNPWNPGTRLVMSRIPFDRDAILLWPRSARRMLREGGFQVLRTDFRFIFPRALKWLRPLETPLARVPLGAQYQVLGRKQ
jgi:SAM-dependent methyltransferase